MTLTAKELEIVEKLAGRIERINRDFTGSDQAAVEARFERTEFAVRDFQLENAKLLAENVTPMALTTIITRAILIATYRTDHLNG